MRERKERERKKTHLNSFKNEKQSHQNEPNDVVYASLGTLVTISADEYRAFARGLALLSPTRALWKLSDADLPGNMTVADLGLAANVKALAWVPQNDLLGDGRLAAFVTHGGINSIYEAAYHGVPVAGIPIFGDQPDNVAKAVREFFFYLLLFSLL